MFDEIRRCVYCDKKFSVDKLDPGYKCMTCKDNYVKCFVSTGW
jgi:DNA-directed RNA polymerase subunit RPC12/RpoP